MTRTHKRSVHPWRRKKDVGGNGTTKRRRHEWHSLRGKNKAALKKGRETEMLMPSDLGWDRELR